MERLFVIETDRAMVSWSAVRAPRRGPPLGAAGLLRMTPLRAGLVFGPGTSRAPVPDAVAGDPDIPDGPILFEEADYEVYARALKESGRVSLHHEDPLLDAALRSEEGGRVLHGLVNFGSHIGRSAFTLRVDGVPEVRFEVEVFPSKLDYVADHREILAEVQEIATGLALVYLASTRQAGKRVAAEEPTALEWTLLLRSLVDELERALRHVAERPLRGLERRAAPVRAERVTRADAAIRAAVSRGRGEGRASLLPGGVSVRERLPAGLPSPTLDTPEHRWLAAQILAIRRRLAAIRQTTAAQPATVRRRHTLGDLDRLEARLASLSRLEPIAAAAGEPPPGFASLRLLTAPGYREAYGACLTLARGLRVEGGPLDLPVKGLAELYEAWCFLATLRVLAGIPGVVLDLRDVFRVRSHGLEVHLARGRESTVRARGPGGRRITITYNPLLDHPHILTPQRPDLVLTIEDRGWPALHLVLDAKYRVDDSPEYVGRYGAPGPPDEALNVLHRYRDAILERARADDERPLRAVVQAAAAFPYREVQGTDFAETRLFRSLAKVGIGAIPLLPRETRLLTAWLRGALLGGAWALSDTGIGHASGEHASDWRRAAAEPVLIGALRKEDPGGHLAWVCKEKLYYAPLAKKQRRQFVARWIGLYAPASLRGGSAGAVTHLAEVRQIEVTTRGAIRTPWEHSLPPETTVLLFHLREVKQKERPIENADGRRMGARTWSSRLAVDRAEELGHLALETDSEWKLYERLTARGVAFSVEAGPARVEDPGDPRGRARFRGEGWTVRYAGAAGFVLTAQGRSRSIARVEDVVAAAAGAP